MRKSVALLTLMSLAPQAFAQNYNGYSGTIGDLNSIWNPPSNIQGIICQHTVNSGNEHSYKACSDGVAAARYMAEKYAQSAGGFLGCIDGFYQGIYDGYLQGKNPTVQMIQEANAYVAGVRMDSAESRALNKAKAEAQTESADQIISRYRQVLGVKDRQGRVVLPNKKYEIPKVTFKGFDDGYETDIQNGSIRDVNFQEALNQKWVTNSSSFEHKIAASKAYEMQRIHASTLCDNSKTIFGRRNMPQLTIWDYFKAQRDYDFQNYGWNNADWAWSYFDKEERNLDHYQNYLGIANLEKTVMVPVYQQKEQFKRDAQGNLIPKLDSNGNPVTLNGAAVYETEIVQVQVGTEPRRVKLDQNDINNLRNLYSRGFKDAYATQYAKEYASKEYHRNGLDKYAVAKIIGIEIGKDVADQFARREAYNNQYKLISATRYAEEAKNLYVQSFNRLINIFENNPVVEIADARIIGELADGIFRSGEALFVDYVVNNLGEVSRPVTLSLSSTQDVNATDTHVINPPVLDTVSGTSNILGQISNQKMAKDTINVGLALSNPSNLAEVAQGLNVRKNQSIKLNDYAELDRVSVNLNVLQGELSLNALLINPSEIETPALPVVEILLDGSDQKVSKNIEKINGKSNQVFAYTISNLDPMLLISKNEVAGTVQVKLAGKVVDKKRFSVRITENTDALMAKYFHNLVTKSGVATGANSEKERLGQVVAKIDATLDHALKHSAIKWKRQEQVSATIIGDLQRVYRVAAANDEISTDAQRQYDLLASMLAKKVNNKGVMRIRGLDKHYLNALKVFSPSISTKWRHHK
jgi:hypothetical protein